MRGLFALLFAGNLFSGATISARQSSPSPSQDAASVAASPSSPAAPDARVLYQQLQDLRLDGSRIYQVSGLRLRRGPLSFTLSQGRLALYQPLRGRVTGAVFTGVGRVIMIPRQPSEKLSLRHYLGFPLLDQSFTQAYFRFTDDTASDFESQLAGQGAVSSSDSSFSSAWNAAAGELNSWHSLRVLSDFLAVAPRPYFYAGLSGGPAGAFDVLIDPRRQEPVLVGQTDLASNGQLYDVWASLPPTQSAENLADDFQPVSYAVSTTINEDRSLDGETTLQIHCLRPGESTLDLHIARELQVGQVLLRTDAGLNEPLTFFQSPEYASHGASRSGGGDFLVVLPQPSVQGRDYQIQVAYHGTVITDAGNGVLFVAERGSWYASVPGPDRFVPFTLAFRWPRRLTLVATGKQIEDRSEGQIRVGRWVTPHPVSVAGFNLGEYAREVTKGKGPAAGLQVDVYANRQLEDAIAQRMAAQGATVNEFMGNAPTPPEFSSDRDAPVLAPGSSLPSPAATLSELGGKILNCIVYLEKWNGPFPFERLSVAQIPGSFGQGWPGLVYLPTLAFLPPLAQQQAGVSPEVQQQLSQLVPFHEVTHQWWGNTVGVQSYRDAWILESIANYLSLVYSDSRQPNATVLPKWLDSFRRQLILQLPGSSDSVESAGPLSLGYRLHAPPISGFPDPYDAIVYGKGTWVMHMLRMMLRKASPDQPDQDIQPSAAAAVSSGSFAGDNPDAAFIAVLQELLDQYRFQAISTADFRHAVERHMTDAMDLEGGRRMDWFFDEWVNQTGIPRYHEEHRSRLMGSGAGARVQIHGTLFQEDVSAAFTMPIPLYVAASRSANASRGANGNGDGIGASPASAETEANPGVHAGAAGPQSAKSPTAAAVFLGNVVSVGPETKFQFTLPASVAARFGLLSHPSAVRLAIDPRHIILCVAN